MIDCYGAFAAVLFRLVDGVRVANVRLRGIRFRHDGGDGILLQRVLQDLVQRSNIGDLQIAENVGLP